MVFELCNFLFGNRLQRQCESTESGADDTFYIILSVSLVVTHSDTLTAFPTFEESYHLLNVLYYFDLHNGAWGQPVC